MQRFCKHAFPTIERLFSAWFVQSDYKEESAEFRDAGLPGYELGADLGNWQLQDNGKKGIRLWKEDFMCDVK
jgi:hypothetical protein